MALYLSSSVAAAAVAAGDEEEEEEEEERFLCDVLVRSFGCVCCD